MSSVSQQTQQTAVLRRESKLRRFKSDYERGGGGGGSGVGGGDSDGKVPSNILDCEEEAEATHTQEQSLVEEFYAPEPLRVLSPPPSELDYTLGQTRGETIAEIYNEDFN